MGDIIQTMTAKDLADKLGVSRQTMEKRVQRKLSGQGVGLSTPLSADQIRVLSGRGAEVVSAGMSSAKPKPSTKPAGPKTDEKSVPPAKKSKWVIPALYFVLIASTIASVYNLLRVSFEIADMLSAIVLTVVLSVAAVVFVASGIKHSFTRVLVAFLIAFEAVCNMVRIYGGLTRWELELPTPFLATLTAVFHTGTYATATAVGAITAILIAGVQYASIFEINKHA